MSKSGRQQYLLISHVEEIGSEIESALTTGRAFTLHRVASLSEALQKLSDGEIKCVIFSIPVFHQKSVKFISKLRDIYREMPIIIVSGKIQREAFDSATEIKRVVILEQSFVKTELLAICEKVAKGHEIYQRKTKRFSTDQMVDLERMLTGEVMKGFLFNLSQGGAFINIERGVIVPGDILKMNVKLDKLDKSHLVFAKVIWVLQQGFGLNKPGAGLKFMKAEEVYSSLLDTVK
ncbi:MAG: PilZ domain-containing protein [Oligoflexia bacterium]|nr:PilZ domain-containing protein [Oligoflexia bacterium]